jgi:hypothetical protein
MKGLGVALVLVLLLAPVGVIATGVGEAAAPPPPPWVASFPNQVILGNFLNGTVHGPTNGTFTLSLYAPPWNASNPIVVETETLNSSDVYNASIPTRILGLGVYELNANVSGGARFYIDMVQVVYSLNTTVVNNDLYQLQQEISALEGQIRGLAAQVTQLTTAVDLLFWVFFGLTVFYVLYDLWKKALARAPGFLRDTRAGWRWFWRREPIRMFSTEIRHDDVVTPGFNPERKYVSHFCEHCKTLMTWPELVAHLATHGRYEPLVSPRDYVVNTTQRKEVEERQKAPVPYQARKPSLRVDMGDLQ